MTLTLSPSQTKTHPQIYSLPCVFMRVCVCERVYVCVCEHQEIPGQAFQLVSTSGPHVTGDTQPRLCVQVCSRTMIRKFCKSEGEGGVKEG